jgi:hypothetical protein
VAFEVLQKKDFSSEVNKMAKPIRKYGKGAVSLAVFEKTNDDGS